jgi:hypothetical protein
VAAPEESGVQGATILAKGKATDLSLRTENHLGNWLLLFSLLDNGLNFGYDLDRRNAFDSTRLTNVWLASLALLPAIGSSSTRLPTAGRGNTIALLTSKRSLHLVSVVVYLDVIDCDRWELPRRFYYQIFLTMGYEPKYSTKSP